MKDLNQKLLEGDLVEIYFEADSISRLPEYITKEDSYAVEAEFVNGQYNPEFGNPAWIPVDATGTVILTKDSTDQRLCLVLYNKKLYFIEPANLHKI